LGLAITMFEPAHDSKVESTPQKSKVYNDVLKENFREKRISRALNFTIES
jgi:heme exporter protein D